MPNGQGTPAERATALTALRAALAETQTFLDAMEIPAGVDARLAGLQDDLSDLQRRVQVLEANS